ncbi:hypothetical protein KSC_037800 [Ktedonobacter sp. SOSP1-52]|uniref:hypothetical protein n=1 Tax=Ktedonobacter sp. SOSP1-52 TaxID=2778366 RepID=UPI0019156E71|nr:hypothetical protein [Ktedonobacter sp. SOSP1-52]GHO64888.1 hypothetical protein KSC_037800 [Ktedonobacter sp. SOSP1-52]
MGAERFSAADMARERLARQDQFEIMLRRQGWHLIRHKPVYTDPRVIRLYLNQELEPDERARRFYESFGDNTFRKLLRHIFFHKSSSYADLKRMCSGEQKLEQNLARLLEDHLVTHDGMLYHKSPAYKHIDNLGPTLEWYIAEWFRDWLQVPARHGVALKGVADGGDLDVVAFVDSIRVMVESKSGSPNQITENELRLFLQRAADFNPEIAVLLIDTESSIDRQVEILNKLRAGGDPLTPQDNHHSLFWGVRHIYVINAHPGLGDALSAVLRLYYSRIRHMSFFQ